jgi:hypothetical protein
LIRRKNAQEIIVFIVIHLSLSFFSKLYQKKKRLSASKKILTPGKKVVTPGRKKTPTSAKRRLAIYKPEPSSAAGSSKRALFTSPVQSKPSISLPVHFASRDYPRPIQALPKRSLFSPAQKRKRSPSSSTENRTEKTRRLESPTQPNRDNPLTVAPTLSSFDETCKKRLYYNSYPKSGESSSSNALNNSAGSTKNPIGLRRPLTDAEKKVCIPNIHWVSMSHSYLMYFLLSFSETAMGRFVRSSVKEN